ncbi:MAG TPA: type I polyketide synthase, partial [Polyangiaceae bacterium]|nr:type I polyketide synthase [Polyangiaceae bacterium]
MDEQALRAWLAARIAAQAGTAPAAIDLDERFSRYGLDSVGAVALMAELSAAAGRELGPVLLWQHPSINALARAVASPGAGGAAPEAAGALRRDDEPIAVVGLACRFPQAEGTAAYWRLLREGVDAIVEVPRSRWDARALFDADLSAPGKLNTRWGGFIEGVDRFEPSFFGISPREACYMDPQQRLMLELAWEAFEDAGVPPRSLRETATGVFVGVVWTDYASLLMRDKGRSIAQHTITGFHHSIVANRISYVFGLQGPSVALDTACSSSLVAVHQACENLRAGESEVALAGGVNLNLIAESTIGVAK